MTTSETKWTPGEWRFVNSEDGGGSMWVAAPADNEDGLEMLACICGDTEETLANALLMANAKRLYEALAKIEHDWDGEPEDMIEARAALRSARVEG